MKLSDFLQVQISTYYEKIVLKFVVCSTSFSRPGTILLVVREITRTKVYKNIYNSVIKSGMYKRSMRLFRLVTYLKN